MSAKHPKLAVAAITGMLFTSSPVHAFDILRAEQDIPAMAAGAMATTGATCEFGAPKCPLQLAEVVERALCSSSQTRTAWAMVKAQVAGVGVARAAYLPTISVGEPARCTSAIRHRRARSADARSELHLDGQFQKRLAELGSVRLRQLLGSAR